MVQTSENLWVHSKPPEKNFASRKTVESQTASRRYAGKRIFRGA